MWLAHALTLSRIPLAVAFFATVTWPSAAFAVLAAAALTDLLDGRVARRARARGARGRVAEIGAWLDPLCDKIFAALVIAALAIRLHTDLGLLALIGAREVVLVPLAIAYRLSTQYHPGELQAAGPGKVATAAQFVAVGALLAHAPGIGVIAVTTAALGLFAAALYVRRVLSAPAH